MKVRSLVLVLCVLVSGLAVGACGSSPTSSTVVYTVAVSGTTPIVGSSAQFVAMATLSSGATQDITSTAAWSSSNTAVATVSSAGVVTALSSGSVTISATYSGVAGNDPITVP
jgi:uncharacterized protein YjdB